MSIYSRDNTNYATMIDNMIRNRLEGARIRSDNIRKQGEIWSNFTKDTGKLIGKGLDYYQSQSELNDLNEQLSKLEERRDTIRDSYTQSQDYKPYTSTDAYKASEQMKGYTPDYDVNLLNTGIGDKYKTGSTYIVDDAKSKWLADHPGMTEEDYYNYINYMNSVYGGK